MNNTINIKIKLLNENAKVPVKKHETDIGYDLFSDNEYLLKAQSVTMVHLGISIELPNNTGGFVLPRSGLSSKHLIAPINSPGLIDPGYTGELMVPLMNYSNIDYTVECNERIAQLVAINTQTINFQQVDEHDTSDRSTGGFGSTGKN